MTNVTPYTRWIGSRPVDVTGWKLSEADTRARANARMADGVGNGNWSGLEIWRDVGGQYVAFQVRYIDDKPKTYSFRRNSLRALIETLARDFYEAFSQADSVPSYWMDVFLEAALRDREIG